MLSCTIKRLWLAACVGLSILSGGITHAQVEEPDPLALLRGVLAAREAIRTGIVELTIDVRKKTPFIVNDIFNVSICLDGERRTTIDRRNNVKALPTTDGTSGDASTKLLAMNNDRDAFVRTGLGKWVVERVTSAWDGKNLSQYDQPDSAGYKDHLLGTSAFVFDPRLLGILSCYVVDCTAARCLGLDRKTTKMVGRENINGIATWHVSYTIGDDNEFHFWIEDRAGFRVHKHVHFYPSRRYEVLSTFDPKVPTSVVPTKVTTTEFDRNGKHSRDTIVTVTNASWNVPVDPKTGTIASLGIPKGKEIVDERIHLRIGYWNGEHVVEKQTDATKGTGPPAPEPVVESKRSYVWYVGGIAAMAIVGAFVWRLLRSATPA